MQIGITFVGILTGAFGDATIAEFLARYLDGFPLLTPYGATIGVVIALNNPKKLARLVAPTINRLSRLAHPLVVLLSGSSNMLLRILRIKPSAEAAVTVQLIFS